MVTGKHFLAAAIMATLPIAMDSAAMAQSATTAQAQRLAVMRRQAEQRLQTAKQARYGTAATPAPRVYSTPARSYATPAPTYRAPTPSVAVTRPAVSNITAPRAPAGGVTSTGGAAVAGVRPTASAASLAGVRTAMGAFAADVGRAPTAAEGLGALLNPPPGVKNWRGPYISSVNWHQALTDPWGNPYRYTVIGAGRTQMSTISSDGPDGLQGTADDLSVQF